MANTNLKHKILTQLYDIISETLKDVPVTVYLFGSWARGEEKRSSDIDIAITSNQAIPPLLWTQLQDHIEESTIPYHVDLVDLAQVDEPIRKKIEKEGIVWSDYTNA